MPIRTSAAVAALSLALGLAACAPPQDGCGLIGCVSSPYLRARGGPHLVGINASQVIGFMGGAPTSTYALDPQTNVLTWQRVQQDRDFGTLACSETLMVRGGQIVDYGRQGNCGA